MLEPGTILVINLGGKYVGHAKDAFTAPHLNMAQHFPNTMAAEAGVSEVKAALTEQQLAKKRPLQVLKITTEVVYPPNTESGE